tara:strand:+ start:2495 stop:2623 length:129 start_codon:yes stop_codon:yes gene_type:complete
MKKINFIALLLIILLVSCGRKGDLLPPPEVNSFSLQIFYKGS